MLERGARNLSDTKGPTMKKKARRVRVKGNRSKGARLEVIFAPELLSDARAAAGAEPLAEFVRAAVRERVSRLQARR